MASHWQQFQKLAQEVGGVVSLSLNSLLIHLVLRKSPKHLGSYKYLIIFSAVFEILYAVLEVVVQPIFHSIGSTFVIIVDVKNSFLGYHTFKVLISIYCGFFGSVMAIFSIQFVYRFWVVSGNPLLKTFNGLKMLVWFLLPLFSGLIWGLAAYFPCAPRPSSDDYLRSKILEEFGLDVSENVYIAPYFYEKKEDGSVEIFVPSFVAICLDTIIIAISVSIACFFGVKCYRTLNKASEAASSEKHRALQKQLFYSLVTQTVIPVILMHIPAFAMFMFAFFGINPGSLSGIVTVTIALFPAIDPLPTIFIVKNYRKALRSYLFVCLRKLTEKLEPSESVREMRAMTA